MRPSSVVASSAKSTPVKSPEKKKVKVEATEPGHSELRGRALLGQFERVKTSEPEVSRAKPMTPTPTSAIKPRVS